jgi:hypothetical protein
LLSFTPLSPTPGVVSIGVIFAFTYMCIHFCTIFTFLPLSPPPPHLPLLPIPPASCCRTCSAFLFSDFAEEKKMLFLL